MKKAILLSIGFLVVCTGYGQNITAQKLLNYTLCKTSNCLRDSLAPLGFTSLVYNTDSLNKIEQHTFSKIERLKGRKIRVCVSLWVDNKYHTTEIVYTVGTVGENSKLLREIAAMGFVDETPKTSEGSYFAMGEQLSVSYWQYGSKKYKYYHFVFKRKW